MMKILKNIVLVFIISNVVIFSSYADEGYVFFSIKVDVAKDKIVVIYANTTEDIQSLYGRIGLIEDSLPPPIYVKSIKIEAPSVLPTDTMTQQTKWKLAPNYASYAFSIPSDPTYVNPGNFVIREWGLQDLLGVKYECKKTPCKYYLKFATNAFLDVPPTRPISDETEWILYEKK